IFIMMSIAFFFQAEDGIRDFHVTGVQTCALPISFLGMISENRKRIPTHLYAGFRYNNVLSKEYCRFAEGEIAAGRLADFQIAFRSEERRVGKECRCRRMQ